ncbi:MAG: 50S ribosomal protein L17 [Fibrobacterales bacterium]
MRHGVKKFKLNRTASHRKAMLKNLATSIIKQGIAEDQMDRQVKTTVIKAKAVRGLVDRLVTYAKKGDLTSRRQAAKFIQEPAVLQDLFEKVGPRYADRQGGYTRILKLSANRKGDNAEMAIITLVEDEVVTKTKKTAKKATPKKEEPKVEASIEAAAE